MVKKKRGIIRIIISILLVAALIGGAVVLIIHYSQDPQGDYESFSLKHDGETVDLLSSEMSFTTGAEERFDVSYNFVPGIPATRDYSVRIIPNKDAGFDYEVEGLPVFWSPAGESKDLSALFSLKKETSFFTLAMPYGMTIETILAELYPGKEVTVADSAALSYKPLCRLEVYSYDEKIVYKVNFTVCPAPVENVETVYDGQIFGGGGKSFPICYEVIYDESSQFVENEAEHYVIIDIKPLTAKAGDKVIFRCTENGHFLITSVDLYYNGKLQAHFGDEKGTYEFTMPPCSDVTVKVTVLT